MTAALDQLCLAIVEQSACCEIKIVHSEKSVRKVKSITLNLSTEISLHR